MGEDSHSLNRRKFLASLAGSGTVALTGCQSTGKSDETPTDNESSPSVSPDKAPKIISQSAQPQKNGQTLIVGMKAEDDEGLEYAAIRYGGQEEEPAAIEGRRIDVNGELTELGDSEFSDEPGKVIYLARDTAGQETRVEVSPDENAPQILNFSAEPTDKAGEIKFMLEGKDDVGLEKLGLRLEGQPQIRENVSGQKEHSIDQHVALSEDARFQQNTLTASIQDWNGNTAESEAETYVRKYDVMSDTRFDITVNYFTAGEMMFKNCLQEGVETQPEVGAENYGNPIRPETTTQHIDQMQGHGINRIQFNFGGGDKEDDREQTQALLDADLASDIEIEPTYWASLPYRWTEEADKKQILEDDMTYMRDHFLKRENAVTHEGRPVVGLENPWSIVWNYGDEIVAEWGDYESFVDEMRSYLTVDGTDPFIRANAGLPAYKGFKHGRGETDEKAFISTEEFFSYFDAISQMQRPSPPDTEGEIVSWEELNQFRERMFRNCREFADNHNMEYFPKVMPGFDSRANACWGDNHPTNIYRSTENLHKELRLAEKYATADKIHVFTWNDWTEGTQIEPGTFRGNEYGNDYLEVIQDFQKV